MNKSFHKMSIYISIIYLLIISIFLVWHRVWFSPDQFFVAALLITLLTSKFKQFIKDWSLPVTLFLGYDYLRGLVPKISGEVNIHPMINFDKAVFGLIPTNRLQDLFFSDGLVHWYDYLLVVFYMSHFIVPMMVGFTFWLHNKKLFREYYLAILLLSYSAFITYVIYPAMPPWMASQQGFIPQVYKIMDKVFANFPTPIDLPSVYRFVGANLVAAVPSLHAAYPWLTFLFILKGKKVLGSFLISYVFVVWFAVIYLGEHYVFDILIGMLYASVVFILVTKGEAIWQRVKSSNFGLKLAKRF